jgi:competence protein ComEC
VSDRDDSAPPDRADLRLASGAVAAWLVAAGVQHAGAVFVLILGILATAVGGVGLLVARHRAVPALASLALVLFCIALVLLPLGGRLLQARVSPLHSLAASHAGVMAELRITRDPAPLAAQGPAGAPRVIVATTARSITVPGRRIDVGGGITVIGPADGWLELLPGQLVRVAGNLAPSLDGDLGGVTLFARAAPEPIGRPPWWQRAAGRVRSGLRVAADGLPDGPRGLLPGLVDGDTANLDPVLDERFRLAGLTHLVAVSGTNCSILLGAVLLALRRTRVRPWQRAVLGALVLVAFVVVARPSPSVLRAAAMAVVTLLALASGRPRQAVPALAATVLALLLVDPKLAGNAGFVMSAAATGALLLLAPGWATALRRRHVPAGIAEATAVAAAAHLVTAPVVAAISGQVSLVAVPANVLAEMAVVPATILGFAAALLAPVFLPGARVLAELAGWPCRWLVKVAEFFGGVHGAVLPWPGGLQGGVVLLVVLVGLCWLTRRAGVGRFVLAATVAATVVQFPIRWAVSQWPPPAALLVTCDVGQGDALAIPVGAHRAVVIDSGPDPVAVDRCLRDLGITDVPLLVLTHLHIDHVGGLAGVFHGRRVGRVVTGPLWEPASGVHLVRDILPRHGLGIDTVPVGAHFESGPVRFDVLGPVAAFHGTHSDPNNSSVVLRATIGSVRMLLAGDMEMEAQRALLASGADVRADVLKVPHHGSAYFDPAFLAAVGARIGTISVGLHNDYGHPSPRLLLELATLGMPARRTDLDGDVAIVSSGAGVAAMVRGKRGSQVGLAERRRLGCGTAVGHAASPASDAATDPCPQIRIPTSCPPGSQECCCSSEPSNPSAAGLSARSPPRHATAERRGDVLVAVWSR